MNDLINRQAAIDVIEKWLECSDYNEAERHIMRATESILYDLPSVNQQEPCEDAISREDIEEFKELMTDINGDVIYAVRMSDIRQLPSVKPQDCDKCEVGNPCLYCKHEFEPQESEDT